MSDIDLKALRKTCDACVASDRLMPVANAWQVLAVFDRLESAERRAEEAEKERDALRKDAERYRWLRACKYGVGSYHHAHTHNARGWFEALSDEDIDAAMEQEAHK